RAAAVHRTVGAPPSLQSAHITESLDGHHMDCGDGSEDLSLDEILTLYSQPINEEQAWAVCYQCCRTLAQKHRRRGSIGRDGAVKLAAPPSPVAVHFCVLLKVIYSLGVMIYKALDYGLKENEERELSPPLERLIDMMTNTQKTETDSCPDEGYEATEEEDECEEDDGDEELDSVSSASEVSSIKSYRDVLLICSSHLPSPSDAPNHYLAVCRALYAETRELHTFLEKIRCAKENLRRMEGGTQEEPEKDLNELQNADWACFWVQVMRDLRHGVKLKKVQERQYNPLPIEYQLTPYEMLMDDIRSKRYKLRKVMVNGDIPPRLKKSAHEIILEFIRSRPPLNPVSARKLKPHPPRPRSLHERLLEDIKAERKLRPVSPDMIRRHRLGEAHGSDAYSLVSEENWKLAGSTRSLASGMTGTPQRAQQLSQRKRLLKAPTLAELDSSESEEEPTKSSSSRSTSLLEDTSPETAADKKAPPKFLPVSATPQPEKHQALQRRHSVEREAPAFVRSFAPPSKQSSKSLEEFCYPVECLTLTVEEVMHIRQVLVKAELEKFQQYKDVYNALKKGKLCFIFFRPVCAQCSKKIRLPSKPYSTLPIYSLGPSAGAKDVTRVASAPPEPEKHAPGYGRHSLRRRSCSRDGQSKDELDLPKELTEDWVAMEVCVDCKKFITEIICSSKRSLSVASKRARLNRKTQSFYMPSSKSASFHPAEHPISEM
uniref:Spire-type actin nucleation factor 1a n=1 Tax=Poecilia latipinna TaxID=48699 RepID=A0A3B3TWX0_9TELE